MLTFIDISNWQSSIDLQSVLPNIDAIVCKATEGVGFVDKSCDKFVQQAIKQGKPWGFYHFARNNDATKEAEFFHKNCLNYFGSGIPVLDWEDGQSVTWVNTFVRRIHELTDVWPWVYANPWRFKQGEVETNCGRWVASYPSVQHPTFAQAKGWEVPSCPGTVCAWQFCSDGRVSGYSGNLDCDLFYGDEVAWRSYAKGSPWSADGSNSSDGGNSESDDSGVTFEGNGYRVTIERT